MFLLSLKHVLAALFLAVLLIPVSIAQTSTSVAYPGLQFEFPAGGELRIENEFGHVAAEVWKEKYVYLTTADENNSAGRSSVVIDKNAAGFAIRVVRKAGSSVAPISLNIKIPETARVEFITGSGGVSLRNVPAATTIKSIAGDVSVELDSANVDIVARSSQGLVRSKLPQYLSETGHILQARWGTGRQTLRIDSETGDISLSPAKDPNAVSTEPANDKLPDLSSQVPTKGAGTPAPAMDVQEIGEGDVIRVDSQLATMNMSVIDRNTKRGMVGLTQSDFRLFENGSEQKILQFDSSSAPFDLWLMIDLSGSTRDVVKLMGAAALRFVDAARPSDRVGVIAFAGQPVMISTLTLDRPLLRERIKAMGTAAGDTKLYDALDFVMSQSLQDLKSRRRTAIILMSDGLDNSIPGVQGDGSKLSYKELLSRVGEFDGVLYTLWVNTEYESLSPLDTQPEAFDAAYDRMKELADTGGGVFYEVERIEDLAGAYERVVADLGTVYSLAYRPSDKTRDGKWRAIRVSVVDRPSAIARGKRGYYAN